VGGRAASLFQGIPPQVQKLPLYGRGSKDKLSKLRLRGTETTYSLFFFFFAVLGFEFRASHLLGSCSAA
jgi:hypothetical protein